MKGFSKKRVVCAAAAVLVTGMSFSVFVSAEPGESGRPRAVVVAPTTAKSDRSAIERGRYVRSLGAAGTHAPSFVPPGQSAGTRVVKFPAG